MFKTLLITMALVSMVCYLGCEDDGGVPLAVTPPVDETPMTKDDSVIVNCYLVRDAVEAFAAANNGRYPVDPWYSETQDGRTAIDFLPNREALVNPFSGARTEPTPGTAAHPGQTGYVVYPEALGYVINGLGSTYPDELFVLTKDNR